MASATLFGINIYEHLNFNERIANICKSWKLNTLLRVSSLLSHQRKRPYQQPSILVSNSFISGQFNYCPLIWMFASIRSYKKVSKLHKRSFRSCQNDYTSSYDEHLTKQSLVKVRIRNIQQLMIEIFKCLKGLYPSIIMRYLCWKIS